MSLLTREGAFMTNLNIAQQRLHNQHITQPTLEEPAELVKWFGAVQAQDYASAKWALGLRSQHIDDSIEQAFTAGTILRTHVMRPTWHFVSPADIRWLLTLTAPRVNAANAYMYRKLELDDATFARSNTILAQALQSGKQCTRPELVHILEHEGITTTDLRFTCILMRAELDMIICSGPRRGKQFTYALLDERAPVTKTLERNEALAELTRRYFTSHGPATLQDYTWWSGLTTTDARAGIEMIRSECLQEVINGKTYWFSSLTPIAKDAISPTAYVLPPFDEYTVAYEDRSDVLNPAYTEQSGYGIDPTIVINGHIVGTWKRTFQKKAANVILNLFAPLNEDEMLALHASVNRYGAFLNMPANVTFS